MRLPTLAEFQEAAAFVHETLDPTPQIPWPLLAQRTGAEVWVKHENHTPICAFKVGGAASSTWTICAGTARSRASSPPPGAITARASPTPRPGSA